MGGPGRLYLVGMITLSQPEPSPYPHTIPAGTANIPSPKGAHTSPS